MYFWDRKIKRNLCQNEKYLILEAVMCDSRLEHFLWTGYVHFGFWKKEEKNTLWINKFRTFLFVFDSHIGNILILYVWINMQIAKIFVEMFQKLCNNIIWISIKDLHLTNSNKTNTQKNILNPIQPDLISVNCTPPSPMALVSGSDPPWGWFLKLKYENNICSIIPAT